MARPFTLFTGQWADLPLEKVCELASSWGYDGLEIACWGDHFEVDRALREDGYLAGRWPPGHALGWEHTFTHQARDLLTAIADGAQPLPSFGDGLAVPRVLDAVARSAASGNSWERVT